MLWMFQTAASPAWTSPMGPLPCASTTLPPEMSMVRAELSGHPYLTALPDQTSAFPGGMLPST